MKIPIGFEKNRKQLQDHRNVIHPHYVFFTGFIKDLNYFLDEGIVRYRLDLLVPITECLDSNAEKFILLDEEDKHVVVRDLVSRPYLSISEKEHNILTEGKKVTLICQEIPMIGNGYSNLEEVDFEIKKQFLILRATEANNKTFEFLEEIAFTNNVDKRKQIIANEGDKENFLFDDLEEIGDND